MFNFRSTHDPVSPLIRTRPEDNNRLRAFTAADDKFSVYVHADVLDFIQRQAALAGDNEAIGLLAGRICNDPRRGPFTLVMAAADAREGEFNASPSFVRLLPVGHTSLRQRLSEVHPDREIVGWYHTHPHWQPRFSEVDLEQQRNWEDPNHVGIVYGTQHSGEPFGVYQGPQAILLTSRGPGGPIQREAGIETKQLARVEPRFSTTVLIPPAESAVESPRPQVPLHSRFRKSAPTLIVIASALMFLALTLAAAVLYRRVSSIETKLNELVGRESTPHTTPSGSSIAPASTQPLAAREASSKEANPGVPPSPSESVEPLPSKTSMPAKSPDRRSSRRRSGRQVKPAEKTKRKGQDQKNKTTAATLNGHLR
jgi:proteasome lid subunit RPN8/RPN11